MLVSSEGYCKLFLTCRLMTCVSAAACCGSVQVLSVDPVSHFHTVRYNLTTQSTYVQRIILVSSRNHCCSGKAIIGSVRCCATYIYIYIFFIEEESLGIFLCICIYMCVCVCVCVCVYIYIYIQIFPRILLQ